MIVAAWLVWAAKLYAGAGALVAFAFVLFGVDRIDPSARGSYAFRPMIVPGVILLWPLVLARWIALEKSRS